MTICGPIDNWATCSELLWNKSMLDSKKLSNLDRIVHNRGQIELYFLSQQPARQKSYSKIYD